MNYTLYRYVPKSLGPKLGPRIPQPWFWTITAMDYPPSVYDNDARTSDGRFQGALARSLNRLGTCFRDHGYSNGCGGPLDSLPSWLLGPDCSRPGPNLERSIYLIASKGTARRSSIVFGKQARESFFPVFGCLCNAFKKKLTSVLSASSNKHDKSPTATAWGDSLASSRRTHSRQDRRSGHASSRKKIWSVLACLLKFRRALPVPLPR
jgi:hypothetical protein